MRLIRVLILAGCLVSGVAAAQDAELDEVLVTGEQPGPGLWKVSGNDHVLWILGSYGPLPKQMVWRSRDVEARIAGSQELLSRGVARPNVGFFTGLKLLPTLAGVRNNPDGARLAGVVPADLYARWRVLKEKYLGRDSEVEKWRPIFAAQRLYAAAIDQSGLTQSDQVRRTVARLANQRGLRATTATVRMPIDRPRAALQEFKKSQLDDLDCFAKTLERLETDLELMRARANAWAIGDLQALRRMVHVDQSGACIDALLNSRIAEERGLRELQPRLAAAWTAAAEAALMKNASSFAVLPIDELLKPDGYLGRLRELGYAVEPPYNPGP